VTSIADLVTIATRAYAVPLTAKKKPRRRTKPRDSELPPITLVFDSETTIDAAQAFTFGAYRVYAPRWLMYGPNDPNPHHVELIEEGLFHADDLADADCATLRRYCAETASHAPTEYGIGCKPLALRTRTDFVDNVLYPLAVQAQALIVGFNLPFDISRIAVHASEAGGAAAGGFSFTIWEYELRDAAGRVRRKPHPFRPRITIKPIGVKGARISFTRAKRSAGDRQTRTAFRGHFLDLHTVAFALTNRGYSLASACAAFGVEHGKAVTEEHGRITPAYVAYCRRDVLATWELYQKLRAEYERHPITLQATKAFSPASIGKAYLDEMRIRPPNLIVDDAVGMSTDAILGACLQAYFGGRAECRIRRAPVPVVYTDFLSMYPTVNSLMGLWQLLTAETIAVVDATAEVVALLQDVTPADLFQPETWRQLPVLVQVRPDGDVLPVRAQYGGPGSDWSIGVNHLDKGQRVGPLWYTLADCVAAKLLGDRVPAIDRALRFVPRGTRAGMRPVRLGGEVPIDPRSQDFFRTVIEERARVKARMKGATEGERVYLDGLQLFLKTLANATSYGIFVELNRQEGEHATCTVWNGNPEPFTCDVDAPEEPGPLFFPPLATLITGAARLMLALLERRVRDAGGNYAFCDTDSMAIVASEAGGLVPCPGGPERLPYGGEAIRALAWSEVDAIVARFAALNPYDRATVPGSVLKVEDVNFDQDGTQRQLWAYSISAKRYVLYQLDGDGVPHIADAKAHGLGHVMAPDAPPAIEPNGRDEGEADDGGKLKPWMRSEWDAIVREAHGLAVPDRPYLDRPACGRITLKSLQVWRAFRGFNRGKPYAQRVKPFGFLLTAHVAAFGHPSGVDPARFRLAAPFETDAKRWPRLAWRNLYDPDGGTYSLLTGRPESLTPRMAMVQTYRDLVSDYRVHPEAKSAGANGESCDRRTVGLLRRRHVYAVGRRAIGKESNRLAEVEDGLIGNPDEVYTTYTDRAAVLATVCQVVGALPVGQVAVQADVSRQQLAAILAGRETPRPNTRVAIERAAQHVMIAALAALGTPELESHTLPFDVLATLYAERLASTRDQLGADLGTLVDAIGERRAAGIVGVSHMTVSRWRRHGLPGEATVLASLATKLAPYQRRLSRLATVHAELAERTAEHEALAAALAADPHTPFVHWLDRTHLRYDAEAWRRSGRLVPVRSPYARDRRARRETVDYTDILDRTAQALGETVHALIAALERVSKQQAELGRLTHVGKRLRNAFERERVALRNMAGASARRGSAV
jgi:hypothetical protein